jgi:hypothetical protein
MTSFIEHFQNFQIKKRRKKTPRPGLQGFHIMEEASQRRQQKFSYFRVFIFWGFPIVKYQRREAETGWALFLKLGMEEGERQRSDEMSLCWQLESRLTTCLDNKMSSLSFLPSPSLSFQRKKTIRAC